jgi:hypothetical protein
VRTAQIKEVAHGEISSTWIPSSDKAACAAANSCGE